MMDGITECRLSESGWACDGYQHGWQIVRQVESSHFITETLLPLGFVAIVFAVAAFIGAAAFTLIFHHVKLAEWRLGSDDETEESTDA